MRCQPATTDTPLAACSAVAIAPCSFALQDAADGPVTLQVLPVGTFRPADGRPLPVAAWHIDATLAARVIERFRARKTPPVLDYEHQTLNAEDNGQPAPAAGFFQDLIWREGQGLFAVIELTQRAREFIAAGEYRYFSPVISYDKHSGNVLEVRMGALTNNPAIDGMAPVALRAAARFALTEPTEEPAMSRSALLVAVATALSLSADATEEQAVAAFTAFVSQPDPLAALRQVLGQPESTSPEELTAVCAALRTAAPDPAQYVPVATVQQMQSQIAALSASQTQRAIDDLVKPALAVGKLLPAQESWARELGSKDLAALTAFINLAQPIAALSSTQTHGVAPTGTGAGHGLSNEELAVCTAAGIDPKDFAATKAA